MWPINAGRLEYHAQMYIILVAFIQHGIHIADLAILYMYEMQMRHYKFEFRRKGTLISSLCLFAAGSIMTSSCESSCNLIIYRAFRGLLSPPTGDQWQRQGGFPLHRMYITICYLVKHQRCHNKHAIMFLFQCKSTS